MYPKELTKREAKKLLNNYDIAGHFREAIQKFLSEMSSCKIILTSPSTYEVKSLSSL